MLENALLGLVAFLSLLCFVLMLRLQKERACKTLPKTWPLEDVFNALQAPIFYKKGQKYEANKAFHRAFGSFAKEAFERLDTLPKHAQHTLELTFDNGIHKSVLVHCSILLDAKQEAIGTTGIIFDTSELNRSKEHLLVQKERLELAIEGSGDGIWDWDMHHEKFFFSKLWKQIMGYEEDDKPQALSSWLNLVHPKDMAMVNEKLAAHLDEKSDFLFIEHRIRDSEPLRWITVRGKAVFDKRHKPLRLTGTIRDITERKNAEAYKQGQQALFLSFFENLPAISFIKNAKGQYLYLNRFYQKYIGFRTWNLKTAMELFTPEVAEAILESDRLAIYEGMIEQTVSLPTEEGKSEIFKTYKFPIENDEGEKFLCGFGVTINKSFT
jgi:two-component system, NarL family, sensor histidine kinase UhpB